MTKTTTPKKTPAASPARIPKTAKQDAGLAKPDGAVATAAAPKTTKSDTVIALLSRPEGATIEMMMAATAWQSHSVRGFLAGTVKKKLGKSVLSEKTDAGRVYRIGEQVAA